MGLLWRMLIATFGFILLRQVVYPISWGHSSISRLIASVVGVLLVRPLAGYSNAGFWLCVIGLILAWFPYVGLFLGLLSWSTESGLRQLAEEQNRSFSKADGLFQVEKTPKEPIWIGNVLTKARSLHPSVDREETYYMLAFVVELPSPPPLQCSLMKGWSSPKYFEREWRHSTMLRGDTLALSVDAFMDGDSKSRETGGKTAELSDFDAREHDERFAPFVALVNNREQFEKLFSGEFLEEFFSSAFSSLQFEFNMTPTSINIYTTYCGYETQKQNCELLSKLVRQITQGE